LFVRTREPLAGSAARQSLFAFRVAGGFTAAVEGSVAAAGLFTPRFTAGFSAKIAACFTPVVMPGFPAEHAAPRITLHLRERLFSFVCDSFPGNFRIITSQCETISQRLPVEFGVICEQSAEVLSAELAQTFVLFEESQQWS
jgi:hypothetical protein